MSKFGNLIAQVETPFKVEIIYPVTQQVIKDNAGKKSFISVFSTDSAKSRDHDKAARKALRDRIMRSRNGKVERDDELEENIAKLSGLIDSWYLVDPVTGDAIDLDCTPENAADIFSEPGSGWLFIQPWIEANEAANFLQKPSKNSADTPKRPSETAAS